MRLHWFMALCRHMALAHPNVAWDLRRDLRDRHMQSAEEGLLAMNQRCLIQCRMGCLPHSSSQACSCP